MNAREKEKRKQQLSVALSKFDREKVSLPGISNAAAKESYLGQLLESIRRVEYIATIVKRDIADSRADPGSEHFDPHKAAILFRRRGDIDEAFWVLFLSVYFGRNAKSGWRLLRDVYGGAPGSTWTWDRIRVQPNGFMRWLVGARRGWERDGISRGYGNHRKYESLTRLPAAIDSYVKWVGPPRTHTQMVQASVAACGARAEDVFDNLYASMSSVISFGRTARFDYLTMVGKTGLADIRPACPYLAGSTGPLKGAKLLFGAVGKKWRTRDFESRVIELGEQLGVGMQVMEDSLCNWQKSPERFVPFRG
jgi:hypothetical protein